MPTPSRTYIMGHTDHERRRLSLQAQFLNPLTQDFFRRAGISQGMRVLDLGCGVGDVSLIAARMVGPGGSVTGLDIDPAALDIARGRAAEEGLHQVTFEAANIAEYAPETPFDAVTARLILVHTPDPAAIVRRAVSFLRPGGVIALQDCDFTRRTPADPPRPLWDRLVQLITSLLTRATPHANVGTHLHKYLVEAGTSMPECRGECAMDGDPESAMYDWIAETIRSLLPGMEAMGLVTKGEIDSDGLADLLRAEAASIGGIPVAPMLIAAFARRL